METWPSVDVSAKKSVAKMFPDLSTAAASMSAPNFVSEAVRKGFAVTTGALLYDMEAQKFGDTRFALHKFAEWTPTMNVVPTSSDSVVITSGLLSGLLSFIVSWQRDL